MTQLLSSEGEGTEWNGRGDNKQKKETVDFHLFDFYSEARSPLHPHPPPSFDSFPRSRQPAPPRQRDTRSAQNPHHQRRTVLFALPFLCPPFQVSE